MRRRRIPMLLGGLAMACPGPDEPESVWISLRPAPGVQLTPAALEAEPPVLIRVERVGAELAVNLQKNSPKVTLTLPGGCPVIVTPKIAASGTRVDMPPWLTFPDPVAQAGFGSSVTLQVEPGCDAARTTAVDWSVTRGTPKGPLEVTNDGHSVKLSLPDRLPEPRPWGIVPISAAQQGQVVLRASFVDGRGVRHTARASVSAAARASGLPSVTEGQALLLGGSGWHVTGRPAGAKGDVVVAGGAPWFTPATSGTWTLTDEAERSLTVMAGRVAEMPLDCTRADCHGHLADVAPSNMLTVFQRGITGALGSDYDPHCAMACHTTGEPGLEHGGFWSVLEGGGEALPTGERAWEDLSRSLRRLGGVGCLACHGPAAIPPETARWSILRSDVCATCHDLPPRYGHSAAWASTKMARADESPETRNAERGCTRCHTTAGFLVEHGFAERDRPVPPWVGPIGLGCATCHDPHDEDPEKTGMHAMLRDVAVPGWLESSGAEGALSSRRGRVCVPCHLPEPESLDASASAAAIWAGRGGIDPQSGNPFLGSAPHGGVEGGCIGCHHDGPETLQQGAGHAVGVRTTGCKRCHEQKPVDTRIRDRALELLASVESEYDESAPPHGQPRALDRKSARDRAIYDLRLVVEDAAAAVHNPGYARGLVAAAEATLKAGKR